MSLTEEMCAADDICRSKSITSHGDNSSPKQLSNVLKK